MLFGEIGQKTNIRFRTVDDCEFYITAIDVIYDSEDTFLTRSVHKLNSPKFNK